MNKYKVLIIVSFILLSFCLPKVTASIKNMNLLGRVIVLDAGHGGVDNGAQNGQIIEKKLNLILVQKLERELLARGANVYLTRSDDGDLSTTTVGRKRSDLSHRAKYINDVSPDMYLSIHLNSAPSSYWKGLQIFYTNKNEENKKIAETFTNYLKSNIANVRDIKYDSTYYMYKQITKPGILIEAGFISNPDENYLLRQEWYQDKLVKLIADSIELYYEQK